MNLFEQAVIHIYNGKSVKNVYYDPPFGMDIASLVFFLPIVRKQWVSFTLADDELCRLVITCSILYDTEYGPHKTCRIVSCLSASREIVLPAIAKPDQLNNRNRLPLASEFSHCCACHVICMCIKRCLFVFVASKKGPCGSCKQCKWGNILQPLGGDSPIKIEKKKK